MFDRIAIIGVGLIGGSFALACKEHGLAKQIVGCSRKQETLDKALELGLIDVGFTDVGDAVKDADLVMLCTPLSTYEAIAQAMSGSLKDNVIITDAGSVKGVPSKHVLAGLDMKFHPRFVPGHPIAGTEKSGPEAAFASLYDDKKVILTPLPSSDKDAMDGVASMWSTIGAKVETLEIRRHDFIYATVSHSVQFLSYAFGMALADLSDEVVQDIAAHKDKNFEKYIRLTTSDPAMWRDIFVINSQNVREAVKLFDQYLLALEILINSEETVDIAKHLDESKDKRLLFHEMIKGKDHTDFWPSDYSGAMDESRMWLDYLPRLIAATIMETIEPSEYEYATSAGLRSISKNIILQNATDADDLIASKHALYKVIELYRGKIHDILDAIEYGDTEALTEMFTASQEIHARIVTQS